MFLNKANIYILNILQNIFIQKFLLRVLKAISNKSKYKEIIL